MKNYIQSGKIITAPAPAGGVLSGAGILVGSVFGVACANAAEGDDVEISTEGVFELPKATGESWAVGDPIFWDAAGTKLTKTTGNNLRVGIAASVAITSATEGQIKLAGAGASVGSLGAPQTAIPDLGTTHINLSTSNTYTDAAVNGAVNTALDAVTTKLNLALAALRGANIIAD